VTTVTVGIPTLNGPDRLARCLVAIEWCTRSFDDVRVLVCDDGSTDENLKLNKDVIHNAGVLRQKAQLEMLVNEGRLGIAQSWNRLVRHHASDVAVLLNDDIEVVDDWLDVLVYSVTRNPKLGMVALNSYVALTKAQVQAMHPGAPWHAVVPRIDYHEAHLQTSGGRLLASTGPAFAFRRAVFDEVGGFDERYFCFYEELDFGVSLRRLGYLHAILSYPIAFHMGGATTSTLDSSMIMRESHEKFVEKWGAVPGELRDRFGVADVPPLDEWNTLASNWR
jgi:GT2 family glycosyltransferase